VAVIKTHLNPIVYTADSREIALTPDEYAYYKAVKRLEKYAKKQGRLMLFGASGILSIRLCPGWKEDEIDMVVGITCDGGDGGDTSPSFQGKLN
jgi:hypothetical protein